MKRNFYWINLIAFLLFFSSHSNAYPAYTDYLDTVQKIYIAYYGRPADPIGQEYWAKQLDARGGNLAAIIDAFGNSAEATTLFSGMSNAAKVNAIYQQCFHRDAEVAGLTYYTIALTAGTYTQASIMLNILNGATGTDATAVANKLAAANLYTAGIDTTAEILAYDDTAAASARAWLATIDATHPYIPIIPIIPIIILNQTGATKESVLLLAESVNQFSFNFYGKLTESEKGNIFYSPLSMSQAFSVLYEGAGGTTADEMEGVFGFEKDPVLRRASVAALNNRLNTPSSEYSLSLANAVWIQKDFQILDSYLAVVRDYYGAEVSNLDFVGDPFSSVDTVNNWASEQTNGKIPKVLDPEQITPDLRLIITNAIYFKGKWLKEFDKADTKDMEFRVSPDEKIKVPMMYSAEDKEAGFRYMENEMLQMLELPYKGDALSMLVLLPKNDDLAALESALDSSKLDGWRGELVGEKVRVYLPKFRMETSYELTELLKKMGLNDVFNPGKSDLSGIDGTQDLYVKFALQKAFVEVNEEGTEAAAVTVIGIGITSVPPEPPVFKADHPFIFLIQEKETGSILFMGRVSNPLETN